MVLITVTEHINQCYTNDDGDVIRNLIIPAFKNGEKVVVSFKDIVGVSSSFVNSAFIALLENYKFDHIKDNLTFADSSRHTNDLIKKSFSFEVFERKNMQEV